VREKQYLFAKKKVVQQNRAKKNNLHTLTIAQDTKSRSSLLKAETAIPNKTEGS
jgi:hypothetical protein